jgi:sarcosine oxidase
LQHYDAIVIGAGANGSATAFHLARAGVKTLLLEQFEFGHSRGSSHGDSRIIRLSYEHAELVQFARRAYAAWDEVEKLSGEKVLYRSGGVDLAAPDNASWDACRENLRAMDIAHETLTPRDLRCRFPQFVVPENCVALWQGDTGFLHAAQAVRTLQSLARRAGAALRDGMSIDRIERQGELWLLSTAEEKFSCRYLALAAGAWINRLLAQLDLQLPVAVSKEQWAYFPVRGEGGFARGEFPVFIDYDSLNYGFPEFNRPGVKLSTHHGGTPADADTRDFEPNAENLAQLSEWVRQTLPGLAPEPACVQTCLYTNLPDFTFLVDHVPGVDNAVIVAACSGEGFKFSAETGRVAARLLLDGEPAPARFRFRTWS